MNKRRQTLKPLENKGFFCLSLLYRNGTPSQRWHCKMVWTSKPSAVCSATMTPDLHSAPTPTQQGKSRTRPHKRWAASWRRSCKQKKGKNTGEKAKVSSPVLFGSFRTFRCVGHGVGQAVDPHFDPHHFQRFCNKKAPKTAVFDAFWSCWADSNCRPHPYQASNIKSHKPL